MRLLPVPGIPREGLPVILMVFRALVHAFAPLGVVLLSLSASPLVNSAFWRGGSVLGYCLVLLAWRPGLVLDGSFWLALRREFRWFWAAVIGLSYLDTALFFAATAFVDIGVASVIVQCGPFLLVLVVSMSHRGTGVFMGISPGLVGFLLLGLLGVTLVIASQHGTLRPAAGGLELLLGSALALLSASLLSLNGLVFRWGRDLSAVLSLEGTWDSVPCPGGEFESVLNPGGMGCPPLFGVLLMSLLGNLVSFLFCLLAGLWLGGDIILGAALPAGLMGFVIYPVTAICWGGAMLLTRACAHSILVTLHFPSGVLGRQLCSRGFSPGWWLGRRLCCATWVSAGRPAGG